jgi:hypothetical protein
LPEWCAVGADNIVYCTWFSLKPPLMDSQGRFIDADGNLLVDTNGNLLEGAIPVFAIGNNSDGLWVSRFHKNEDKWWTVEDDLLEENIQLPAIKLGTEIDVGNGKISMY